MDNETIHGGTKRIIIIIFNNNIKIKINNNLIFIFILKIHFYNTFKIFSVNWLSSLIQQFLFIIDNLIN